MRNKILRTLFLCMPILLSATICQAEIASVKMGIANWKQEPQGNLRWDGTDIDVESDFFLGSKSQGFIWANIEHTKTRLPQIGLMHTKMGSTGSGTANSGFSFGGFTFPVSEPISTVLEVNETDLILYYEMTNIPNVHIDLGIVLRYIDGIAQVTRDSNGEVESMNFDGIVPMIYTNVTAELPITGLSVGVQSSAVGYNGHSLFDIRAKIAFQSKAGIGVELGYRHQQVKLDGLDSFYSDLEFSGTYLGVTAKF